MRCHILVYAGDFAGALATGRAIVSEFLELPCLLAIAAAQEGLMAEARDMAELHRVVTRKAWSGLTPWTERESVEWFISGQPLA